jgi:flagellar basal-body rod modification protein FlgD
MSAAVSGIWNHAATAQANPLTGTNTKAMATSGADSSTDSSTADATISANDFLTLLVTEMQNQDPTSDTDPNEYIDQLVNVNSLEQLININQTLSTAFGTSTSADASPASSGSASATSPEASKSAAASRANTAGAQAAATPPTNGIHGVSSHGMQPTGHPVPVQGGAPVSVNQGNLNAPSTNPSALRVARALDGQRITR